MFNKDYYKPPVDIEACYKALLNEGLRNQACDRYARYFTKEETEEYQRLSADSAYIGTGLFLLREDSLIILMDKRLRQFSNLTVNMEFLMYL